MKPEVERVRGDLETIEDVLGVNLPFTWQDVKLNLLLMAAGVVAVVLAWRVPIGMIRIAVVPIVAAGIPSMVIARRKSLADGEEAARRREHRLGWVLSAIFIAIAIPFVLWQGHRGELIRASTGGACVLLSGVMCAAIGVVSPGRRYYWGFALPLIVWGYLMPMQTLRQIVVSGAICFILAEFFAAAIQAWQLRERERA